MDEVIAGTTVEVPGVPVPQGSLRSFRHSKTGNVVTPQASKVIEQRERIAWHVREALAGLQVLSGPVKAQMEFVFPRPKSHYGTGRNAEHLKPSAPWWHTQRPDLDKLVRLVLDALTGVWFVDDNLVVDLEAKKRWSPVRDWPGSTFIMVMTAPAP